MNAAIKIVKVFIASPGGLNKERQTAKRIADEINQSCSEQWKCRIQLIGWEDTLPRFQRAQSLINQDLDKCQYFIGILWDHWGSNSGNEKYTSGFEEEFERAKSRFEQNLMKDIALFFKEIPEQKLKDPGPSLEKVLRFRDALVNEKKMLFKEFKGIQEFDTCIRHTFMDIGWKESSLANVDIGSDSEYPKSPGKNQSDTLDSDNSLIELTSSDFISEILQKPSDWDATTSYEIARFRLIAASISRWGNDDVHLGNHDANLLYAKREIFNFSDMEIRTLIETGVAGFQHQNVPLWHWVNSQPDFRDVEWLAVFGKDQTKLNAINIIRGENREVSMVTTTINAKLHATGLKLGWQPGTISVFQGIATAYITHMHKKMTYDYHHDRPLIHKSRHEWKRLGLTQVPWVMEKYRTAR